MKYLYNIEDGQFSREIYSEKLLGYERDIIQLDDDGEMIESYIVYIEDNYIQCIGNIERCFPKSLDEHKKLVEALRIIEEKEDLEFLITYMNRDREIFDEQELIIAKNKDEARKLFKQDYPQYEIYQID